MVLTFAGSELWAQERTVSGTVTSAEDGTTLPGVNILLKGTSTGTVTDFEGKYTLSVPAEGGTSIRTPITIPRYAIPRLNRVLRSITTETIKMAIAPRM